MIHVKRPTKEQLREVANLFDAYRVFYKKDPDLEAAYQFLYERFTKKESIVFVAETKDELIGFTQLYPLFSSTNLRPLWLLNDLFVAGEHRGNGVSKLLLHAAQEHCVLSQAQGIMLETEKTNLQGNALYPKMNFVLDQAHNFYFWNNPSLSSSQSK